MGSSKGKLPAAAKGASKKRRSHCRRAQQTESFSARLPVPTIRTKHKICFELVENIDKKKKLVAQVKFSVPKEARNLHANPEQTTCRRLPPAGYEFVASGNPDLTTACKELSREKGHKIYIVTQANALSLPISYQVNRVGYHFRKEVVEEVITSGFDKPNPFANVPWAKPEPIPQCPRAYHAQVDAALRDFFPRIPNTCRSEIISHAFTWKAHKRNDQPIGLQADVSLARRVQLAALAHIRHAHTKYDEMLHQMSWVEARKKVEPVCLDFLVKWRGDEENGRDDLDEILREIIVLSDDEDEEDDAAEDSSDKLSHDEPSLDAPSRVGDSPQASQPEVPATAPEEVPATAPEELSTTVPEELPQVAPEEVRLPTPAAAVNPKLGTTTKTTNPRQMTDQKARRGFERYRRAWEDAVRRNEEEPHPMEGNSHQHLAEEAFHAPASYPGVYPRADNDHSYVNHLGNPAVRPFPQDPALAAPVSGGSREVNVVSREQAPLGREQYRHAPSHGHHLQDMLVPSVEPAPSNPPRQYVTLDGLVRPQDQPDYHCAPKREQSHGFMPRAPHYPGEQSEPRHQGIIGYQANGSVARNHGGCDLSFGTSYYRGNDSYLYSDHPRGRTNQVNEGALPVAQAPADRLVINSSWPGSRSNPILMEDRGGFYERVEAPPDSVHSRVETREPYGALGYNRQALRVPINQHMYPQDAMARRLPENQVPAGYEMAQTRNHHRVVSAQHPRDIPEPHRTFSTRGCSTGMAQRPEYTDRLGQMPLPALGQHDVPSAPPGREAFYGGHHVVAVARHGYELDYRQHGKRPLSNSHYEDFRPAPPSRVVFTDHASMAR
ncbi:hypothetical protein HIM_03430 [Hirsutella minnesotensis 3608]|uniref:DUF2293 domain-containing protein n=1 Tax=Hirsutella minnesotensis 3608 TaxID=1043627 RepID=A0A0F8A6H9_9HYPO|nr:hypothetical protein HIM_03430 [Hirsutella minnesotensis 3608]